MGLTEWCQLLWTVVSTNQPLASLVLTTRPRGLSGDDEWASSIEDSAEMKGLFECLVRFVKEGNEAVRELNGGDCRCDPRP